VRHPAIGRRCGGLNDQLVPPLCPRRTTASRLHSTLSVCDSRIKVDQLPAALRGSVLFTRLLSIESGNIHFYRAVRQHTDRIISIRLACLSAARTRGTSLAAPFRVIFFPVFFLTRTPFYARFLHVHNYPLPAVRRQLGTDGGNPPDMTMGIKRTLPRYDRQLLMITRKR